MKTVQLAPGLLTPVRFAHGEKSVQIGTRPTSVGTDVLASIQRDYPGWVVESPAKVDVVALKPDPAKTEK